MPGVATGMAYTPVGGDDPLHRGQPRAHPAKGSIDPHRPARRRDEGVGPRGVHATFAATRRRSASTRGCSCRASDVHIHVPAGAVPKDGPSAGTAMFTSLASLMLNKPVRADVAMTGEITLRGLVLPIGGLKEKTLAALRAGIKEVIVPKRNEKDLPDLPDEVKANLKFHFVENVDEVLRIAVAADPVKRPPVKATNGRVKPTKARPAKRGKPARAAGRRK